MVNGEDHLNISFTKKGNTLKEMYEKVSKLLNHMEENMKF